MRRWKSRCCQMLLAAACALATSRGARADEPPSTDQPPTGESQPVVEHVPAEPSFIGSLTPVEDWVGLQSSPILLVSQVERSVQPIESARQPLELEPRLADLSALSDQGRGASLSSQNLRELAQLDAPPTSD